MTYQVGIDLGTTFTAAAVHRDGRSNIFSLGNQAAAIPSVVLLREDETELTGEAAVRRALTEPERVAREFKRRLGDTTPIIVGGAPYSAEQLMARLLRATIAEVEKREGSSPTRVAVTHPANWGPYKIDLLQQAVRLAGLDPDSVELLTEPQAAAIHYAANERVEPGSIVAVYDLGGGTFDAAILRKTDDGFEVMGRPEGIERMGGIDFDAAVFAHVNRALDGKLQELDPEDPMVISGVARLREDCVNAKVALSSDTDATIPVLLPTLQTDVRITRSEFEALIRPSLSDSIAAMHRAMESAGITADQVDKVLLVGGSSRIPLIAQLVSSELGRPVAVDADPKHSIALGAAIYAGATGDDGAVAGGAVAGGAAAAGAAGAAAGVAGAVAAGSAADAAVDAPTEPVPVAEPAPTEPMPIAPTAPAAPVSGGSPPSGPGDEGGGSSKLPLIIGGAVVALLAVIAFAVFSGGGGDDEATETTPPEGAETLPEETPDTEPATTEAPTTEAPTTEPPDTEPPDTEPPTTDAPTTEAPTTDAPTTDPPAPPTDAELTRGVTAAVAAIDPAIQVSVTDAVATLSGRVAAETVNEAVSAALSVNGLVSVVSDFDVLQPDEVCSDEIQDRDRWACVVAATYDGETVTAEFVDGGTEWLIAGDFHLHFFADAIDPATAGVDGVGVSTGGGIWQVWDQSPNFETSVFELGGDIERLCVRVAHPDHSLESLDSGNCWPVERIPAA